MNQPPAIRIELLSHHYGQRRALAGVSFKVHEGEIFALLGPNGGGKTTLFRILCTSLRAEDGRAEIGGLDVRTDPARVRRIIGVAFQHPSLDGKLSVMENLRHQGHLYGLSGAELKQRATELLRRFNVVERAGERVDQLSGGLARRVDLAKALLHRPRVLLLDEPSTGLDPQARWDLWKYLDACRRADGLAVLMTTHHMDEADRCDRVGIIDAGHLVAVGTPQELKRHIEGECLHLEAAEPEVLAQSVARRFDVQATLVAGRVRIEHDRAHAFIPQLVEAFPEQIRSVSLSRPTLEEVFIHLTGKRFEEL